MSMARRGRKRKIKLKVKTDTIKTAVSAGMLIASGIIFIAFFAPSYTVNAKVKDIVTDLFGIAALLLPFILALGGLLYTQALKWKFIELRIFLGLIGLLFSSSSFLSVINLNGGNVGEALAEILSDAVSGLGAGVILLVLIIVSLLFILDLSLQELVAHSGKFADKIPVMPWRRGKKDKEEEEDDIKITSGTEMFPDEDTSSKKGRKKKGEAKKDLPKSSFEVIPSMSEPKSDEVPSGIGGSEKAVPGLPYSDRVWENPPLDLLLDASSSPVDRGDVKARAKVIIDTLKSFGIAAKIEEINYGPSVTQYALEAASGVRISRVASLHHDLALSLASPTGSVRIEAPIPGKSLIGIEVPNNTRVPVHFKELLTSDPMKGMKSKRGIVLGKDVAGLPLVYDIAKMPHALVAGATGSGKSVFLHSIIMSLLYRCSPQECKFIMIDPKRVELVHYRDIPHLLTPVVTDIDKASSVFRWAVDEMKRRYSLLESAKARNIDGYNEKSGFQALPYIVIVVDELAEIMVADPAQVEKSIIRLAQLARAVGIHLILTVQRPSTNIITGLIKANIPCRVAFNVTSQVDSRVIIDQPGSEKLLGQGDMLFLPPDVSKPIRIQGAYVTDGEVNKVVNYLKSTGIEPEYKENIFNIQDKSRSVSAGGDAKDALFDEAVEIVVMAKKASASLLQRRLSIGYARAARILDELEAEGYVEPAVGNKPRKVIMSNIPQDMIDLPEDPVSDQIYDSQV
jgi:DNA segregation ATPase FtsK/SpoIIIE, S-DNA-T family